jgi:hypothetical protein
MMSAQEVHDTGPLFRTEGRRKVPLEGAVLGCRRCSYSWVYRGSKLAEAKLGRYPVYTSCPHCQLSAVQIKADRLVPAGEKYGE